jgi:Gpi18-like mannosyltransferase
MAKGKPRLAESGPSMAVFSESRIALAVLIGAFAVGILLRIPMLGYESNDFKAALSPWYDFIQQNGFKAFGAGFADYTPPYLYLLGILGLLPLPKLLAIKLLSIAFEAFLALGMARMARALIPGKPLKAALAAALTFLAPTVMVNGASWAQCDGIYASFAIWGIASAMEGRKTRAALMLGIAFAFKLQTLFVAPLFLVLLIKREYSLKHLGLFFVPYLVGILPAAIAGRPLYELLGIYLAQGGSYDFTLSLNAPNIYQLIPSQATPFLSWAAFPLAGAALLGILLWVIARYPRYAEPLVPKANMAEERAAQAAWKLRAAFLFAVAIPFLLPRMHERYFYLADMLAILVALKNPRLFWMPIASIMASFYSYLPFLLNPMRWWEATSQFVPLWACAAAMGAVLCGAIIEWGSNRQFPHVSGIVEGSIL